MPNCRAGYTCPTDKWFKKLMSSPVVRSTNRWFVFADSISIKILNAGAWARSSDRVPVTLPTELEDYIPQVEEFYRQKHNGRKLQWHHLMSNGVVSHLLALSGFNV
jgi:hypothetical protein